MSNFPVFQTLLQDNINLFTTEGLSALLEDCICLKYPSHHKFTYPSLLNRDVYLALAELGNGSTQDEEMIRRIMADPKGWCIDAPADVQQGAKFYERLGKMFDADFSTDLFVYHRVRDNIQQLQNKLGISGVGQRHISIRDRLFAYPAPEDQLMLLECDRATLQNAVSEIIKHFLELVQMTPVYNLFFVDQDEQKVFTTAAAVQEAAAKAVKAEIYAKSFDWKPTDTLYWEGKPVPKIDPDEIHLILHLDWDENKFLFFDAHHPDPSRWPWLAEN